MKTQNYTEVQFTSLPENLKDEAKNKATRIGFTEAEINRLFFRVENGKLTDGVIDKGSLINIFSVSRGRISNKPL
jgi:hypothetical protein